MNNETLAVVRSGFQGLFEPLLTLEFGDGELYEVRSRAIDQCFADFIVRLAGRGRDLEDPLWQGAFIVSLLVGRGQVCCDIGRCGGGKIHFAAGVALPLPEVDTWRDDLLASGVVGAATAPGCPLVLDGMRLYLHRFWRAEVAVSEFVAERLRQEMVLPEGCDLEELAGLCTRLFPATSKNGIDWQQVAALAALVRPFLVISGGPGSGKTYTVARIIAILRNFSEKNMRVALAAPTGKAVSRLKESVAAQTDLLSMEGIEIVTIHRLLALRPGGGGDFGPDHPLPYDLVVVDEASMVDIVLMGKLTQAISGDCRLILLGDHRQLAAVEPGAVFAAFCGHGLVEGFSPGFISFAAGVGVAGMAGAGRAGNPVGDGVVLLRRSHRFGAGGGIGRLARAVASGDGAAAVEIIVAGGGGEIEYLDPGTDFSRHLTAFFKARPGFWQPDSLDEAFFWLDRLRILCPFRSGPRGGDVVNKLVYSLATESVSAAFVPGQPLMVRRNDYQLNLFNGDIGVVSPAGGDPRVFFPDESGGRRSFSPSALPEWETVYAMTVHKSQGSEFDEILLLLPTEAWGGMNRELFYTAITRARKKVHIWGAPGLIRQMVERPPAVEPALASRLDGLVTKMPMAE